MATYLPKIIAVYNKREATQVTHEAIRSNKGLVDKKEIWAESG